MIFYQLEMVMVSLAFISSEENMMKRKRKSDKIFIFYNFFFLFLFTKKKFDLLKKQKKSFLKKGIFFFLIQKIQIQPSEKHVRIFWQPLFLKYFFFIKFSFRSLFL